ncbi:branched-chain amino acid transport system permease protein [Arboricoccus pini]|uniref:Branched-chain amino acid transport system permease protein n=1 Tax=Arboricoccus pini TaxID=1963835 RepID=A0A212RIE0_9PROT|nr:branched-chain amino acid ABC transporter permease [Arboricoccus pini]SNB72211.1 branched-chain amino acid transport system permease protein [Arboricoccus pini]
MSIAILKAPSVSVASVDVARTLRMGLLLGGVGVYLAAVGILAMFNERWIIVGLLTLGYGVLGLVYLVAGMISARRGAGLMTALASGILSGAIAGLTVSVLGLVIGPFSLQSVFTQLNGKLADSLALGLAPLSGLLVMLGIGAVCGAIGAILRFTPLTVRRPLVIAALVTVTAGLFQELIQIMLQDGPLTPVQDLIYEWEGLTAQGAAIVFVVAFILALIGVQISRRRARAAAAKANADSGQSLTKMGMIFLVLVLLPLMGGNYIGQVLLLVGLYILMGMGLNLEVGLAGLLDLGFVGFFAVGAYVTALLTANHPMAILHLNFWVAMPIAVLASVVVGVLFGIPVLGVRGDYLAVATMGLGEIVRVLVVSDAAKPLLGGPLGITQVPKPAIFGYGLTTPIQLYYLTLVASLVAGLIAWRLEGSRLGRAWMALRDDEDVAAALGIDRIECKLLAYGLGAAFAGLAGSIFAVMLASVYPSSFQLVVSINVLALIIVGGMGSLPGVAIGSLVLIGLPELLREFGEYRYLFYGVALIFMMQFRPEGLMPSKVRKRELHAAMGETSEPAVPTARAA